VRRGPALPPVPRLDTRARAARRGRLLRSVLLTVVTAGPLLVVAWLLLSSPLLRLERVEVSGASRLSAEEVVAAADAGLGTPLARVDTAAVRRRVAALAPVGEVEITRSWPRTLRVVVQERQPVAAVDAGDGQWRLVDATGISFASVSSPPHRLARLRSSDPIHSRSSATPPAGNATRAAVEVLTALPEPLLARVRTVSAPTPASVTLELRGGRTVVWGTSGQTARKAAVVEALLRRKGSTVDVTSPSVAVVR